MTTNLNDYKNIKKMKIVYKDLIEVQSLLIKQIEEMRPFKKYIHVQECLSIMHNSRTLIEIHLNKFKRALDIK